MQINKNWVPLLIFVLLVLDLLAFTSILPLFPALIDYYGLGQRRDWLYDGVELFCKFFQNTIGTPFSKSLHSVFFGGVLGSLYCLLQYLSSPLLGALSDVYGRKPILLLSIFGTLLSYAIWANATTFSYFVLSRLVGGLSKASVSICIAFMADVYPQNKVGQGMALIGGAFSVGFLVGPMTGVYFSHIAGADSELAISGPAKLAVVLTIIEVVFVAIVIPETLDISQRKTLIDKVFKNCFLYIKPNALFQFAAVGNRFGVRKMQSYGRIYFVYMFFYSGLEFTLSFLTHSRFNYNSMQQGKMYFYVGILMFIVQGGIVRRIPNNRQHEAIIYGISFTIPAYIMIGYSSNEKVFYVGLALYAFASSLVVPCLTSCISNEATDDVKGVTIGVFRCLGALARSVSPLVASTVFWLLGPTVCYITGGVLLIIPVLMLQQLSPSAIAVKEE
uniref:Major facilitator superfamily (MFS) profile domain-containing protein n=1 Tax=Setaria digitata TaxID=48799 RepID=A0A915PJ88_9BILA